MFEWWQRLLRRLRRDRQPGRGRQLENPYRRYYGEDRSFEELVARQTGRPKQEKDE